jgi:hypothetical protein
LGFDIIAYGNAIIILTSLSLELIFRITCYYFGIEEEDLLENNLKYERNKAIKSKSKRKIINPKIIGK